MSPGESPRKNNPSCAAKVRESPFSPDGAALAERHAKDEVERTLMRLAVIGQLVDIDRKYGLPPAFEPEQG